MAPTTNHYDLIVIGNDLAGLVAGALVARRGKRVLVASHGPADGRYRLGARTLPLDVSPVVHLTTPPVHRVFGELGLWQQMRRQHVPLTDIVHLVVGDRRLDVEASRGGVPGEAEREWPGDPVGEAWALRRRWAEATDEVLEELLGGDQALVADGFWSRRFLTRVAEQLPARELDDLEPLPADHPLRQAARAVEPWLVHLTREQLGKAASLRVHRLWESGPFDVTHGVAAVRQALVSRVELHSGEVKPDLSVGELLVKRGRVAGVSLLGKRDHYGCDHVIVASDPRRLPDGILAPEHLPRPLLATLQAIRTVARRFVMHLDVREEGLSPALEGVAVVVPQRDAPHGIGTTYVRPYPGPREGVRRISITRIAPADADPLTLRETVLRELDERGVLPFVEPYIEHVHSPHDGRPPGGSEPSQDAPGLRHPMATITSSEHEPSLGVGVLPHASGLKNLYFSTRLTLPGLGLEGEFAAGMMAAGLVAAPAKSPFSRSPLLKRA